MERIQRGIQAIREYNEQCENDTYNMVTSICEFLVVKDVVQNVLVWYIVEELDQWFQRITTFYRYIYPICYFIEFRLPNGGDLTGPKLNELKYETYARSARKDSTVHMVMNPYCENRPQRLMNLSAGLKELRTCYPEAIVYFTCVVPESIIDQSNVIRILDGGEWPHSLCHGEMKKRRCFIQIL